MPRGSPPSIVRLAVIAVVGLIAWGQPRGSAAQARGTCPPITATEPYERCQVDQQPRADSTNQAPAYAALLKKVGVGGAVHLRFTVDSTGHSLPASVAVVGKAHPMLASAATAAVKTWTFQPARKGADPVAVRYDQIIRFVSSLDPDAPQLDADIVSRDTIFDGTPRLTVGTPERDAGAILAFSTDELFAAQRFVLVSLAPVPVADSLGNPRITMCVSHIRGGQDEAADPETLRALTVPGRRAVIPRDCPQPFAGRLYDMTRPPRGWIDPYIVTPVQLDAWTRDVLVIDVVVEHEWTTQMYRCAAMRSGGTWRTKCVDDSVRPG